MSKLIIIALLSVCFHFAISQTNSFMGARANGVANAGACLHDEWAIFNNPAGGGKAIDARIAVSYDALPALRSLDRKALAALIPLWKGGMGLGVIRAGDDLYNEQTIAASYAHKLGIASLGAAVNYIQYNAEGFGRKGVFTISAGGIASLTPWLDVGAHIINVNQPYLDDMERLSGVLVVGALCKASEKVAAMVQVQKAISSASVVKMGIEYTPLRRFSARTGFQAGPSTAYLGFGFHPRRLSLDYAFTFMNETGSRHQLSICYRRAQKK